MISLIVFDSMQRHYHLHIDTDNHARGMDMHSAIRDSLEGKLLLSPHIHTNTHAPTLTRALTEPPTPIYIINLHKYISGKRDKLIFRFIDG